MVDWDRREINEVLELRLRLELNVQIVIFDAHDKCISVRVVHMKSLSEIVLEYRVSFVHVQLTPFENCKTNLYRN